MNWNKTGFILLLILSALGWGLAWPPGPLPGLQFILLIPLLVTANQKRSVALPALLYFLVADTICLGWVGEVSVSGAGLAIVLAATEQSLALVFLAWVWRRHTKGLFRLLGTLAFIGLWVGLEYAMAQLFSLSWLSLGMSLSRAYPLIQWYEWTGSYGGTIWILGVNLIFYEQIKVFLRRPRLSVSKVDWFQRGAWFMMILLPGIGSYWAFRSAGIRQKADELSHGEKVHVVVVQSNLNPRTEKFDPRSDKNAFQTMLRLSAEKARPGTECFVWPETSLEPWHSLDEDSLATNQRILAIRSFLWRYKNASLLVGALTYQKNRKRGSKDTLWFNSAIQIENDDNITVYHKNLLVPGVEKPPVLYSWLDALNLPSSPASGPVAIPLGGPSHYLSPGQNIKNFYTQSGLGLGTLICFESAFGSYARKEVYSGAGILLILSNDAWWRSARGPAQHLEYARLLAIENRRSVAQASNGGLSGLISPQGEIVCQLPHQTEGALGGEMDINERRTFYTLYGDWVVMICILVMAGYLAMTKLIGTE